MAEQEPQLPQRTQPSKNYKETAFSVSSFLDELTMALNTIKGAHTGRTLDVRKVIDRDMKMVHFTAPSDPPVQVNMHFHHMDPRYSRMVFDFVLCNLHFLAGMTRPEQVPVYLSRSFADVLSAVGIKVIVMF